MKFTTFSIEQWASVFAAFITCAGMLIGAFRYAKKRGVREEQLSNQLIILNEKVRVLQSEKSDGVSATDRILAEREHFNAANNQGMNELGSVLHLDNKSPYHHFWLGHDIQWTMDKLSQPAASVKNLSHGLSRISFHLSDLEIAKLIVADLHESSELTVKEYVDSLIDRQKSVGTSGVCRDEDSAFFYDKLEVLKRQVGATLKNAKIGIS